MTSTSPRGGIVALPASPWKRVIVVGTATVILLAVLVLAGRWLRELPAVAAFVERYPGVAELPSSAPIGIPAWLAWQHAFNVFFMVMIVRTGLQIRYVQRPAAHWTRRNTGFIRTKNAPAKIRIELWLHLAMDILWLLNGLVFIVLLLATGQWMRIVPTTWDAFPNALSAALQYASLDWPVENGWVNYNSLQVLAYFVTVFIAAPLAILTGVRMSGLWPKSAHKLNHLYPIEIARAIHFPVMIYFCLFIFVHVVLVFTTGALKNLNHMYAAQEDAGWVGFSLFAVSLVVIVAAWIAARPVVLRTLAGMTGNVSK